MNITREELESTLVELFTVTATEIPAQSRAAVALLLRRSPSPSPKSWPSSTPTHAPVSLDLLFIQRATRQTDPWSAHIAFPGGRRDATDRSDMDTAIRETAEELQLDISNLAHYRPVGRLPDRYIYRSGRNSSAVLSTFVFLQFPSASDHIPRPQPAEVSSAFWVPLSALHGSTSALHELHLRPVQNALIQLIRPSRIQMPAIDVLPVAREIVYAPDADPPQVLLWGMTLSCVGDLVDRIGGRRVDWPMVLPRSSWMSRLLIGFVDALWWSHMRMWPRSLLQRRILL